MRDLPETEQSLRLCRNGWQATVNMPWVRSESTRSALILSSLVFACRRAAAREELLRLRDHVRQSGGSSEIRDSDASLPSEADHIQPRLPPFGTGGMTLNMDGRLHLTSEATFYRSTEEVSEPEERLEADVPTGRTMVPTTLPEDRYHLEASSLISLAFRYTVSFGIVDFSSDFWQERWKDPMGRTPFYSRFLYIVLLIIGWRHQVDMGVIERFYDRSRDRGLDLIRVARRMVDEEAENPKLSTILGLYLLCSCLVGMGQECVSGPRKGNLGSLS